MSGGPFCVRDTGSPFTYFPAGVYLGGSGGQTIVRAIDAEVAALINDARVTSYTGANSTGGGVIRLGAGGQVPPLAGFLTVLLDPADALIAQAGWRILEDTNTSFLTGFSNRIALVGGLASNYHLVFKPLPAFIAPENRIVQVGVAQEAFLTASYLRPGDDLDGDGLPNLLEHAFGLNPLLPSTPTTLLSLSNLVGTNYLTLSFQRATNATGVTFEVQVAGALGNWITGSVYSAAGSVPSTNTTQLGRVTNGPVETITVRDNTPVNSATNRFMRLKVSQP
jgi:hypothetical protein